VLELAVFNGEKGMGGNSLSDVSDGKDFAGSTTHDSSLRDPSIGAYYQLPPFPEGSDVQPIQRISGL
jgi:hypothetical protein